MGVSLNVIRLFPDEVLYFTETAFGPPSLELPSRAFLSLPLSSTGISFSRPPFFSGDSNFTNNLIPMKVNQPKGKEKIVSSAVLGLLASNISYILSLQGMFNGISHVQPINPGWTLIFSFSPVLFSFTSLTKTESGSPELLSKPLA